ncbi:MAG: hypothetical protein ACE5H8_07295, partial [Alphaproteobacteria bacterium]
MRALSKPPKRLFGMQGVVHRLRNRRAALTLVVGLLVTGCTHAIPLNATVQPPPDIAPVPLAVGVHYTPEFETYVHSESRRGDTWAFPLGSASVKLFDDTFSAAFKSIRNVPRRPPLGAGESGLAAVIESRIEGFSFTLPFLKTGTYTAEITYRFTIYSPQGDPFASWMETGWGEKKGQMGFEYARWPGEAADIAMQDAAAKFLRNFRTVPEVRRWLRERGALPAG